MTLVVEIRPLTRVPDTHSKNGVRLSQYSPPHAVSQTTILISDPKGAILKSFLKPIKNRKIVVKTILNAPNCNGVKPTKPFLIKIYEVPQINESIKRYSHFLLASCIAQF